MRQASNNRFRGSRPTEGPTVAVFGNALGLTIRLLAKGERAPAPRLSVKATDESRKAVAKAVSLLHERVKASAQRPVVVTVEA